jgi:hypothetical protein
MNVRLDSFRSVGGKTDIDTLTLVSLYYYDHSDLIRWRAIEKNPFIGALELIYESLTQFSWCYDAYCLHLLNGMFTTIFFLCYAFIPMIYYVYDFILNVSSLREKKNEFILFLF